jgi:hypothetical protein
MSYSNELSDRGRVAAGRREGIVHAQGGLDSLADELPVVRIEAVAWP